jgi:copper chaperone CopZ
MLNIFKKKSQGETTTFKIDGMHCTSCSMSIDGELEDTEGVVESKTSYAKAKTTVVYDPTKVQPEKLKQVIEGLEYKVTQVD